MIRGQQRRNRFRLFTPFTVKDFTNELYYVVKVVRYLMMPQWMMLKGRHIFNSENNNYRETITWELIPEKCSQELCSAIEATSVVLAKGQANYETWREHL